MNTQLLVENRKSCDLINFCLMDVDRLPVYKIIMERFIRSFRVSISNTLRRITDISLKAIQRKRFGDFISSVETPSFMAIVGFEEKNSHALITMDRELAYGIINIILGGEGRSHVKYDQDITRIELVIVKEIISMILSDINEAWKPVHEYKTHYIRSEINTQFIGIIPQNENVLVTELEIAFDKMKGKLNIVVPMHTIFPVRDKLI